MTYIVFHSMTQFGGYRYAFYQDTTFIAWGTYEEPRAEALPPPEVTLDPPPPLPE